MCTRTKNAQNVSGCRWNTRHGRRDTRQVATSCEGLSQAFRDKANETPKEERVASYSIIGGEGWGEGLANHTRPTEKKMFLKGTCKGKRQIPCISRNRYLGLCHYFTAREKHRAKAPPSPPPSPFCICYCFLSTCPPSSYADHPYAPTGAGTLPYEQVRSCSPSDLKKVPEVFRLPLQGSKSIQSSKKKKKTYAREKKTP